MSTWKFIGLKVIAANKLKEHSYACFGNANPTTSQDPENMNDMTLMTDQWRLLNGLIAENERMLDTPVIVAEITTNETLRFSVVPSTIIALAEAVPKTGMMPARDMRAKEHQHPAVADAYEALKAKGYILPQDNSKVVFVDADDALSPGSASGAPDFALI